MAECTELTREYVEYLIALSKRPGELLDSQWLIELANKITVTLDRLEELERRLSPPKQTISFAIELMYKHAALGLKFKDLGCVSALSHDEAVAMGDKLASEWLQSVKDAQIEQWEVRVRPVN